MPTREYLRYLQSLPLEVKVMTTKLRIDEWIWRYGEENVYVSFSGGKDSTVLLNIVREKYPNVKAVFFDTGLEYPEIREFVKTFDNVDFLKPKQTFREVVIEKGYPLFSKEIAEAIYYARRLTSGDTAERKRNEFEGKRVDLNGARRKKLQGVLEGNAGGGISAFNKEKYLPACRDLPFKIGSACCSVMKKNPSKAYQRQTGRKPILATTTEESRMREQAWIRTGCNAFDSDKPTSKPLSFWKEQDILAYIKQKNIKIASVYGEVTNEKTDGQMCLDGCGEYRCTGCQRTGCVFCGFGAGDEHKRLGKSRFELLAETHPKIYDFILRGGEWVDNPEYDSTAPKVEKDGWVNWNPKKIWQPSSTGLGMKFVFDEINKIYKDFIRY